MDFKELPVEDLKGFHEEKFDEGAHSEPSKKLISLLGNRLLRLSCETISKSGG